MLAPVGISELSTVTLAHMSEDQRADGLDDNLGDRATRRGDARRDEEPVLPDVTSDERGAGWGDEATRRDDEWYLSERPPHHG